MNRHKIETVVHGIFLIMGLITIACVLMITVYLIIAGIPAIREIGLIDFLFHIFRNFVNQFLIFY